MQRDQFERYFFPLDSGERPERLPAELIDEFRDDLGRYGYARNGAGAIEVHEVSSVRALVKMIGQDAVRLTEQGYVAGPYLMGDVSYRGIMLYRRLQQESAANDQSEPQAA
ncbi:MAG TPA: hypothetical protein VFP32_03930 [Candidatus Saccharimonadales bacterium]|nr:hypothetical protein [Candidatus Saccharimonadales bacterium]